LFVFFFFCGDSGENIFFQGKVLPLRHPSLAHPQQSCVGAETHTLLRLLTFSKEEILKIQWQSGGGGSYALELAVS